MGPPCALRGVGGAGSGVVVIETNRPADSVVGIFGGLEGPRELSPGAESSAGQLFGLRVSPGVKSDLTECYFEPHFGGVGIPTTYD